jgi:hypothetical protein
MTLALPLARKHRTMMTLLLRNPSLGWLSGHRSSRVTSVHGVLSNVRGRDGVVKSEQLHSAPIVEHRHVSSVSVHR